MFLRSSTEPSLHALRGLSAERPCTGRLVSHHC